MTIVEIRFEKVRRDLKPKNKLRKPTKYQAQLEPKALLKNKHA